MLGRIIFAAVKTLNGPAARVQSTGNTLSSGLESAANSTSGVPLVGGRLSDALDRAARAAAGLRDAGSTAHGYIDNAALILGFTVPVILLALAVAVWLRPRISWVREAGDARGARELPDGGEFLAGRALAKVRIPHLAEYGDKLVKRWKRGDETATHAMARAELDRLGLSHGPFGVPQ